MKIVNYKCPNCEANLKVNNGEIDGVCEYCQSPFHIDDGVIRIEYKVEFNDNNLEIAQTTLDNFKDYQRSEYLFKCLLSKYGHKKEVYIGIVRSIANDFTVAINNKNRLNELNEYYRRYKTLATKKEISEYEPKINNVNKLYWYNCLMDSSSNLDLNGAEGKASEIESYWRHYIKFASKEEQNDLRIKYNEFIKRKKQQEAESKRKIRILILVIIGVIISYFIIDFILLYNEKAKANVEEIKLSAIIDSIDSANYNDLSKLLCKTRSNVNIKDAKLNTDTRKLELDVELNNKYKKSENLVTIKLVDDIGPVITSNNCVFKDTDVIDVNSCFSVFDYTDGKIENNEILVEYDKENLNTVGTKEIMITASDSSEMTTSKKIEIIVTKTPIVLDLSISKSLYVGETASLKYTITPNNISNKEVEYEYDKNYVSINGNSIKGIKKGNTSVCVISKYDNSKKCINVEVGLKCLNSYTFNFNGGSTEKIVANENFCPGTYQVYAGVLNQDQIYHISYSADGKGTSSHITICKYSDFLSDEGSKYMFNVGAGITTTPGITSIKLVKVS